MSRTDLGTVYCNDYGDESCCLRDPDPRYTMRFDDIGEPPLMWCAFCGPRAHAISKALELACEQRGAEFIVKFEQAVTTAENERILE